MASEGAIGAALADDQPTNLWPWSGYRSAPAAFLGRYLFTIKASGPGQGLRPFRNPDSVEDDED
ncbi:hypothetical protein [Streptomyces sp. NPDC051286]|uniref:hypothetical protein n=1 Tax=Streptomyces sp. NPDC051286 TaxID=3365647 RepID=UPI0037B4A551